MVTRYGQLTSEQRQEIIAAFLEGFECRTIPFKLQVSKRSVARVLAEAGINTKRRNRYTLDEGYFDCIDSHVKSYLLGLIAADGCVTEKDYIAFESIDKELTELMKAELKYSGNIRTIQPKLAESKDYASHYRINFSSKQLANALRQWGILPGRSFSGAYWFPKEPYLSSYILGYFDGDGCAYVNEGRSGGSICIVGSLEFARELARLLEMGAVNRHFLQRVYYWRLHSRQHIQAFYQLLYQHQGLGLGRKKQKIEEILRSYRRG